MSKAQDLFGHGDLDEGMRPAGGEPSATGVPGDTFTLRLSTVGEAGARSTGPTIVSIVFSRRLSGQLSVG
jgi:hypothetical protein